MSSKSEVIAFEKGAKKKNLFANYFSDLPQVISCTGRDMVLAKMLLHADSGCWSASLAGLENVFPPPSPRPAYLCSWSHTRAYSPLIFPASGYALGRIELRAETIDLNTMKWNPFVFGAHGALIFPEAHHLFLDDLRSLVLSRRARHRQ